MFFAAPKPKAHSTTRTPSTTFQIVRIASCLIEKADQEDGERGDRDRERGHEDDVDADPAAVRKRRRQRNLARVAPAVPEDGAAGLRLLPLRLHPRLQPG